MSGEVVDKLVLRGLDHVISFTAMDHRGTCIFYMRTYFVKLKKHPNGGRVPDPYLQPSGPDMDFVVSYS